MGHCVQFIPKFIVASPVLLQLEWLQKELLPKIYFSESSTGGASYYAIIFLDVGLS